MTIHKLDGGAYSPGSLWRADRVGSLTWRVPRGNGAYGFDSIAVPVGAILRCAGWHYSGGSDGIDLPAFDAVDGTPTPAPADWSPCSWGAPLGLVRISDGGPA